MTSSLTRPGNERIRVNILRATFAALLPLVLFSKPVWMDPEWMFEIMEAVGIVAVIAGVLGRFWAILYIGGHKSARVVQDGPYSMVRHPLYFFSTLAVIGFGLMLGSLVLTALLGGLTLLILTVTARKEEAYLRATFGSDYDDFAARVPLILPNPTLFRTEAEVTFSVRHLRRNLMDALVFLSFIPLAELMEWIKEIGLVPTFPLY